MDPPKSSKLLYVLLGLVFVLAVISQGTYTADVIQDLRGQYPWKPWPRIQAVNPNDRGVGLQPGDRIMAVDGRPYNGNADLARPVRARHPGDELPLTVDRNGAR